MQKISPWRSSWVFGVDSNPAIWTELKICMHIYLSSPFLTSIFEGLFPPKTRPEFQPKQGSSKDSRYVYMYLYKIYIYLNICISIEREIQGFIFGLPKVLTFFNWDYPAAQPLIGPFEVFRAGSARENLACVGDCGVETASPVDWRNFDAWQRALPCFPTTHPKFSIDPEKWWLEDYFAIGSR